MSSQWGGTGRLSDAIVCLLSSTHPSLPSSLLYCLNICKPSDITYKKYVPVINGGTITCAPSLSFHFSLFKLQKLLSSCIYLHLNHFPFTFWCFSDYIWTLEGPPGMLPHDNCQKRFPSGKFQVVFGYHEENFLALVKS